jgi:tetratricopeptide (TPR) repeat protein
MLTDEFYGNEGKNLWEKGELEKAEKLTRKAIELNPNSSLWYQNLGFILRDMGREEESIQVLMKSIEINNEWSEAYKAGSYWEIGRYYYAKDNYAKSIAHFEHAIEEAIEAKIDNRWLSNLYLELSYNYTEGDINSNPLYDLQKAKSLKLKASHLNPDDLFIEASLAKLEILQNRKEDAIKSLEEIEDNIKTMKTLYAGSVYAYLSHNYSLLENPKLSAKAMSKSLELNPAQAKYFLQELNGDFQNVSNSDEMKPVIEKARAIAGKR